MSQIQKMKIQEKKYKVIGDEQYIQIVGYGYTDHLQSLEDFQVLINDEAIEADIIKTKRPDVKDQLISELNNVEIGFYIHIRVPSDIVIKRLQLMIESRSVLQMSGAQLVSIQDNSIFDYKIDSFEQNKEKQEVTLSGWCTSFYDEVVDIYIVDKNEKKVESKVQRLNRTDLVLLKMVKPEYSFCGFRITFSRNDVEQASLVFKTSHEERAIDLSFSILSVKEKVKAIIRLCSKRNLDKAIAYIRKNGVKRFVNRLLHGTNSLNAVYPSWFISQRISKSDLNKQKLVHFEYSPKISLIVATYNTKESYLKEMIDSVMNQSYSNWELCIADGSTNDSVEKYVSKHYGTDSRIKFKRLDKNYGISGNSNEALTLVTGDYVGFYDHDDFLELDLLYEVVSSLQDVRHDIVYTDEDKFDDARKQFTDPNFKPDFSIDLFRSHNYITHFFCVKKSILDEVGGFISEYDGAQDYDIMFRCIEKSKSIHHIPRILYHWRMHPLSTAQDPESKLYCYEAGKKAIESHLSRIGVKARVEMMPKPFWGMYHVIYETVGNPLVSIIIPNMNHKDVLKTCIDSLFHVNTYKNFEIVIVENNSTEKEIFDYYDQLQNHHSNVRVVKWEKAFNYSLINNFGVEHAEGEYLLFLNNDTEVISPTAISEMLGHCMREEVGAVGAKLLYADDTVQHAGVVIGFSGYAGHIFCGDSKDDYGYMCRAQINCNYSAVTAACLMTRREIFDQVHGFDPDFKVAGNDVDFCLKIRQLNKFITFNAFSLWHHYESKSRGYEDTPEKIQRFNNEVLRFQKKWPDILENGDPFYNKNFDINLGAFKLN